MIDVDDAVEKTVARWPALTNDQLDRIAALLRAGSRNANRDKGAA